MLSVLLRPLLDPEGSHFRTANFEACAHKSGLVLLRFCCLVITNRLPRHSLFGTTQLRILFVEQQTGYNLVLVTVILKNFSHIGYILLQFLIINIELNSI